MAKHDIQITKSKLKWLNRHSNGTKSSTRIRVAQIYGGQNGT